MTKKEIISFIKKGILLRLSSVIFVDTCFLITLIGNSDIRNGVLHDSSMMLLCAFIFLFIIITLLFAFIDFKRLQNFIRTDDQNLIIRYMNEAEGILNRFNCDSLFRSDEMHAVLPNIGCSMIEIKDLKRINEVSGREAGDLIIEAFCKILERIGNEYGVVVRNGGNEFLIIIADCTVQLMEECLEKLNASISSYNDSTESTTIEISQAYVLNSNYGKTSFPELLTVVYKKLHAN